MSRNALILEKAALQAAPSASLHAAPRSSEFTDLVRRLFRSHSALAVIGIGSRSRSGEASSGIAAELAATGKRVVLVRVDTLMRTNPVLAPAACPPGRVTGVWLWPSTADASVDFFPSCGARPADADWLDGLRRDFDSVLLDCPAAEVEPASPEIAALADAAVLVIESGETARHAIQRAQRVLEHKGVKLAGCILMQRR